MNRKITAAAFISVLIISLAVTPVFAGEKHLSDPAETAGLTDAFTFETDLLAESEQQLFAETEGENVQTSPESGDERAAAISEAEEDTEPAGFEPEESGQMAAQPESEEISPDPERQDPEEISGRPKDPETEESILPEDPRTEEPSVSPEDPQSEKIFDSPEYSEDETESACSEEQGTEETQDQEEDLNPEEEFSVPDMPQNGENSEKEEAADPQEASESSEESSLQEETETTEVRESEAASSKKRFSITNVELPYTTMTYTGTPRSMTKKAVVTAKNGPKSVLENKIDYTVTYENNIDAGTAVMIVTGKGNYTGTIRKTFTIKKRPIKRAELKYDSFYYTGNPRTQTKSTVVKTIMNGEWTVLKLNRDYTISYRNNIKAGRATLIVRGKGNFEGTIYKHFTIQKRPIRKASLKFSSLKYIGAPKTQTGTTVVKAYYNGKWQVLKLNRDYTIRYQNNTNVGTATMIIRGKGNFKGTLKRTFRIRPVQIESASIRYDTMTYTGKPRTQTKTTKVCATVNGKKTELTAGTDFIIAYSNNYYGTATMVIKGRGNFTGSLKKTFRITADWDPFCTSTGSVRSAEYSRLCNNRPINQNDPTGKIFREFASKIIDSSVIPGIKQTHIIDAYGNHTICTDMVPQGVCFADGYMLISAYCHEHEHGSVVYVLKDGKYKETINLAESDGSSVMSHAGGITCLNQTVYIAGDDNNCVYGLPLDRIKNSIGKGDAARLTAPKAFYTDKPASCISTYNNKLYVGTFYMDEYNNAAGMSTIRAYDPLKQRALGSEIVLPTNKAQGFEFVKKNGTVYLLISSSYGRGNESELITAKWNQGTTLTECGRLSLPNMSEELAVLGNKLYIGFESAAKTYTNGWAQESIRPLDRAISIDYRKLLPA